MPLEHFKKYIIDDEYAGVLMNHTVFIYMLFKLSQIKHTLLNHWSSHWHCIAIVLERHPTNVAFSCTDEPTRTRTDISPIFTCTLWWIGGSPMYSVWLRSGFWRQQRRILNRKEVVKTVALLFCFRLGNITLFHLL